MKSVPNDEGGDPWPRCELFVEKNGVRISLPFPNNPPDGVMRRCDKRAVTGIISHTPNKTWRVCQEHHDRAILMGMPLATKVIQ